MTREVFVGACAWIDISDTRSARHAVAAATYRRLPRERYELITTNLVLAESYVMVHRYVGYRAAIELLISVRTSEHVRLIYSDRYIEAEADAVLKRYADQDFSLADAVSFVVMRQRGIQSAFSFDHHFVTAGFALVP
jgi:uncharacterized protein